ncbi:MAG: ABC transporter substrate-binding protein [Blautia sp.]|nr:ABC transporter substrate-binding protein [Lachnoclostridium sp.]MCM1212712.1 ABC transporter substrate-binding protein [Blautia sp.]
MRKRLIGKALSLLLVIVMMAALSGCGSENETDGASEEKIVNIGITDSLGGMNPLTNDQTWINKYAVDLEFLPLVDLDRELNFQPMLADSVTTEDNIHFIVHIDENAVWSDGTPVTAEDVEYTVLRLASPVIANPTLLLYAFEGVGEEGFVEEGAESVEGIEVLDEKTIQFTTKYPIALTTFENTYAFYIHTLPKHVLEQYTEAELMSLDWFSHPDVVSGPYMVTDYDVDHYISYTANEKYWKGAPKIEKLNFKILDSSQIYAGLQSGEIDVTHHTMTAIPQEDYENIEALENIDVVYGSPITNQSVFIETTNIPDERVRQALLCAIDREQILEELMKGHGEVVDGFLSSAGPFYDETIIPTAYDPERARTLLKEAGWDESRTLRFYVNSGDGTFVNAAQVMAAQWDAVGVKVEIQTVDLATLMTVAETTDYDLFAVQYTYAPVDPYPDIAWLLGGEGSWTGYASEEINAALEQTQTAGSIDEMKELYAIVDKKVQEDVPMFSAYIISGQGAVNKRLTGVNADVYGFFANVAEWDIVQ